MNLLQIHGAQHRTKAVTHMFIQCSSLSFSASLRYILLPQIHFSVRGKVNQRERERETQGQRFYML